MRGERQQRESSTSYDRGRQYSSYIANKQDEGRNYSGNVNGSERNLYRKTVDEGEVSKPIYACCFARGLYYVLPFNIN